MHRKLWSKTSWKKGIRGTGNEGGQDTDYQKYLFQDYSLGAVTVPFGDDMDIRIRLAKRSTLGHQSWHVYWYSDSFQPHVPWRAYESLVVLTHIYTNYDVHPTQEVVWYISWREPCSRWAARALPSAMRATMYTPDHFILFSRRLLLEWRKIIYFPSSALASAPPCGVRQC